MVNEVRFLEEKKIYTNTRVLYPRKQDKQTKKKKTKIVKNQKRKKLTKT
jgi:hypothetical protein